MGDQSVDRAAMQTAAGQIDTSAGAINTTQRTLQDQVNALIGSGWQGNAAKAFLQGFTQFDAEFAKVHDALVDIHGKLVDSKMKYEAAEESATQETNAIEAELNL